MSDQPRHTKIPNAILDSMADLTEPELRVLLAITRKTIGWQKECDPISLTQLEKLTGLSRPAVNKALHVAIARGWVECTGRGKRGTGCYKLTAQLVNDVNQLTEITSKQRSLDLVNDVNRSSPQLVNDVNTQKKDLKEKKEKIPRADRAVSSDHQKLMELYKNVLPDRRIPNGKQEGAAAKAILAAGYTPEQAIQVYEYLKRRDFWADQHLSLQTVNKQMGAVIAATKSKNGHSNGKLLRQSVNGHSERGTLREADPEHGF